MINKKWIAFIYVGLIIGCFFVSQYIVMLLLMGYLGKEIILNYQYFTMIVSYGLFFLILYGIEKIYPVKRCIEKEELSLKSEWEIPRFMLYGVGLWCISIAINGVLLPFFPEYAQEIKELFNDKEIVLCFIALVIGAPIAEECLFRGKVQYALEQAFGSTLAIIMQGILFGLIHPFGLQKIYASVIGVGFGYIRKKENRLIASIIMHMTINFIGWLMGVMTPIG